MAKRYNHCPKCGRSLGWKNFFKFWQKSKLCSVCEEESL